MKKLVLLLFVFTGCIQTDLEDLVDPALRIDNSINAIDFRVGGSYALKAIFTDDAGDSIDADFAWESSDISILSFSENVATVHSEGVVLVSVRANGLEITEAIETEASRGSLQISGFTPKIQTGNSSQFKFNFIDLQGVTDNSITPTWTSSDESIAQINQDGAITAVGPGVVDISLTFDGNSSVSKLEVTDDPVVLDPVLHMIKFAHFLDVGNTFQFESDYYTSEGRIDETAAIAWRSSNDAILSLDDNGLATALTPGMVTVEASYQNETATVTMVVEGVITARTGVLMGTGYDIEGNFSLAQNEDGDLILTIEGYKPDGPGPYFYLSNVNESRRVDGINLGDAGSSGDISINVSEIDSSVELLTYNFLVIWCEPFGVRLGVGEFDN